MLVDLSVEKRRAMWVVASVELPTSPDVPDVATSVCLHPLCSAAAAWVQAIEFIDSVHGIVAFNVGDRDCSGDELACHELEWMVQHGAYLHFHWWSLQVQIDVVTCSFCSTYLSAAEMGLALFDLFNQ